MSYRVSRAAAIESLSDTVSHREISTNNTHEQIHIASSLDSTRFVALVDTFAVTTQGMIGPVQPSQLPYQIEGLLTDTSKHLTIFTPYQGIGCSPVGSALVADLYNLLSPFPAQLTSGMTWRDSVDFTTCQGLIPTAVHVVRSYIVSGQLTIKNQLVIAVQRTDTITTHGEGALQQHHVTVDATGTGAATYYLDPIGGRVSKLATEQNLLLNFTAAGKSSRFRQNLRQNFEPVH
ncbi:MAG: hypothetical protein ABR585_00510 [Gemmatimonadaceae bacterium]